MKNETTRCEAVDNRTEACLLSKMIVCRERRHAIPYRFDGQLQGLLLSPSH